MAQPTSPPPEDTGLPEPFAAGLSHRTAPPALLERLLLDDGGAAERLLRRLGTAGLRQAIVLGTCERLEIHGADPSPEAAARVALGVMAEALGLELSELEPHAIRKSGPQALLHLFGLASSLDSIVPGEPQILGQLKEAHRVGVSAGCVGPELEAALQGAYAAAARIRAETTIAEQPVSLLAIATRLAHAVLGEFGEASALLVGQGEMGAALADHLRRAGLGALAVLSASERRGTALASALGAHYRPLAELEAALPEGDIVIAALSSGRLAVAAPAVAAALKRRQQRPMLLIDLGVPNDVDPGVQGLDDAFLYTLDDLERIASGGQARREQALAQANAILEEEVARHGRAAQAREAIPAILALRRHFEAARAEVLARSHGLGPEAATRLLINRLLHEPSTALRELAREPAHPAEDRRRIERTLLKLFGIERRYGERGPGPAVKNDGTDA